MTSQQRQLCIQYDATEMMWQEQTTVILIINLFMGNVEHIKNVCLRKQVYTGRRSKHTVLELERCTRKKIRDPVS